MDVTPHMSLMPSKLEGNKFCILILVSGYLKMSLIDMGYVP